MKKSKLQVIIDFISQVSRLRSERKIHKDDHQRAPGKKTVELVLLLVCLQFAANATNYYSRNSGNWNVSGTWSTSGYGGATNIGTYPQAGDIAFIGNGHTILITTNVSCATLNIGQGISGILQFESGGNFTATISGNVTINTGAKLWYNSAVNQTHTLIIGANLTNFGVFDLYFAPNQVVDLVFNSPSNTNVIGTGTWDMNNVTLNKSTTTATQLNIQSAGFESGMRNFIGTYGTYIHNNGSTFSINPTPATFTIGQDMIFKVPLGTMKFASAADNLILQGALYVNGGTVYIGSAAGLQGLRSDRNGLMIPYLEVTNGSLVVYGGITFNPASGAEAFSFKMSGGNILLNAGTTGTNRQVFCINDVAGSSFNMSGGRITIQKPNISGPFTPDFTICGNSGVVTSTGGLVQFGNAATSSGATFNFRPNSTAIFPNFRLSGQVGMPNTLATSFSTTANIKMLSLYIESSKTFDIRSISGTTGDNRSLTLLGTANGTDALYNNGTFNARMSTVTFNTSGVQAIGGTSVTTFYNLSINNSSNITLNKSAIVSNFLSMVSGKLMTTNANILTCTSGANASLGTPTSYVDGPMIHTVASAFPTTKTFPIGKGAASRSVVLTVQHSNATSVTYRSEIFNTPASSLPYTYPPTISTVSHVRYAKFLRQNVNNFTSGKIQMYYDVDDVVADKTTLAVAEDNGATLWKNLAGNATANWTGNITSTTFTTFNTYFSLANPPGGGNPLPIELSSFAVNLVNKKVDVKWTTQTEINNNYFTIERSSNNETYTAIGTVEGAGNTSQLHNYSFTDNDPLKGVSYYRLTQTDFNGIVERFPASVINNNSLGLFGVFPNPSSSGIVHLTHESQQFISSITVQDITGKVIPSKTITGDNGSTDLEIDETYTSKGGIFIISASDGLETVHQKLLIN